MAWTRKSSLPHCFSISAKVASILAGFVTSQGTVILAPTELKSGLTRFSKMSPWKVNATSAPCSWQALAIPQAIERSLATPMTRPFFPAINCEAAIMRPFYRGLVAGTRCRWWTASLPCILWLMIREKADPLELFADWYAEAEKNEPNDPTAMTLATVGPDGTPSVRMVLLKGFDASGFVFYTNHQSRKGEHLLAHPK